MKRLIKILLLLVFFSGFSLNTLQSQTITDFTLTDTKGHTHHLFDYLQRKQAVIIYFWLTTCGNCALSVPYYQQLYEDYGENTKWVKVLSMECDTADNSAIDAWLTQNGGAYPCIGGAGARTYWYDNFFPLLGGYFGQIVGIFPTSYTNPQNSIMDYTNIGQFDSPNLDDLVFMLDYYNFYASVNQHNAVSNDTIACRPNPVDDQLFVDASFAKAGDVTITLVSLSGKTVINKHFAQQSAGCHTYDINIQHITQGYYFVNVTHVNGVMQKKVVVIR